LKLILGLEFRVVYSFVVLNTSLNIKQYKDELFVFNLSKFDKAKIFIEES